MEKAIEMRPTDAQALPFIGEYNVRQMLRKLGYNFNPLGLSGFKAECFGIIASAYAARESEKAKTKKPKPAKRR